MVHEDDGSSSDREGPIRLPGPDDQPTRPRRSDLEDAIHRLLPLHTALEAPAPGDWLSFHHEPGQSFAQYLASSPVDALGRRRTVVIQPIGQLGDPHRRLVRLTADLLGRFFGLPVRVEEDLPVDTGWPTWARRIHPAWGDRQLLTSFILTELLAPRLPPEAAVYLGLTAWDLWPGPGWNFVFGQASFRDRVGVWSLYRNGDPAASEDRFRLCLLRTIKTATHEIGHMLSMDHCTAYRCGMCGSNHQAEKDSRPLAFCPHCLAKVCWATGVLPEHHLRRVGEFCQAQGLEASAEIFHRSLAALHRS